MSKIARIPVSTLPMGWPGFAQWLRATHPPIYRAVARRIAGDAQLNGLGLVAPAADPVAAAASNPSNWDKLSAFVRDVVPQALQVYSQKKVLDLQLKRVEQGLAPYDTAALADMSSVKVGVDPGTRNTGLIIAGILAAAFVGSKLLKGR